VLLRHIRRGGAGFGGITDEDAADGEFYCAAGAISDETAVAIQGIPDAGADGSEASEADADCRAGHGESVRADWTCAKSGELETETRRIIFSRVELAFRFQPSAFVKAWLIVFDSATAGQVNGLGHFISSESLGRGLFRGFGLDGNQSRGEPGRSAGTFVPELQYRMIASS
jgi:hypothetical protein